SWNRYGVRGGNRGAPNRGSGGRGGYQQSYNQQQEGYYGGGNGNYGGGNGSYGGGNGNYGGGNGSYGGGDRNFRGGYGQTPQRSGQSTSVSYGYSNNYSENTRCPNCAKMHSFGACPARGTMCSSCGKPNHWRIACRSNRGRGGSY